MRWPKRRMGTWPTPSKRAAAKRPWPARIMFSSSTINGLRKPNLRMLAAISRICFLEWVRAFLGLRRTVSIGAHSIPGEPDQFVRWFDENDAFKRVIAASVIAAITGYSNGEIDPKTLIQALSIRGWAGESAGSCKRGEIDLPPPSRALIRR